MVVQINDQFQIPTISSTNNGEQSFDDFKLFVLKVADWMEINRREAEKNDQSD